MTEVDVNFDWLNNNFLENVVKRHLDLKDVEIKSFLVKPAIAKGENFLGTVIRVAVDVVVDGCDKVLNYIVKVSADSRDDIAAAFDAYKKEINMYTVVLPALQTLLDEAGIGITMAPKCFYCKDDSVIVLEDLRDDGFENKDRTQGLDLQHALKTMETLAALHAVSIVYQAKNGKFNDSFNAGMFRRNLYESLEFLNFYYKSVVKVIKNVVKTWEGFDDVAAKVNQWSDDIYLDVCKAVEYDEDGINVLAHGDLWTNNILFNYDEGQLKDCKLIDYQLSFWGTSTQDLWYFISNALEEDVRVHHFDDIVQHYQTNLVAFAEKLQYKGKLPQLKDVQLELLKRNALACLTIAEGLPVSLMERGYIVDAEIIVQNSPAGEEMRNTLFGNPRFKRAATKYLRFLYKRGFLDITNN